MLGFDFSIQQRQNDPHYCPDLYFEIGLITPGLKRVKTFIILHFVPKNAFKEGILWWLLYLFNIGEGEESYLRWLWTGVGKTKVGDTGREKFGSNWFLSSWSLSSCTVIAVIIYIIIVWSLPPQSPSLTPSEASENSTSSCSGERFEGCRKLQKRVQAACSSPLG